MYLEKLQRPSWFRYVAGPLLWRASILGLAVWKSDFIVGYVPYDLISSDAPSLISGMFYAVAGVLGVLAGFIITALTIVASSDSESVRRMKRTAPSSLPKKLLYSVLTLLFLSLSIALSGPIAVKAVPLALLGAAVLIATIEVLSVAVLVYIAISPRKERKDQAGFIPDGAR
ncbi:hypothetical protein [Corynebacterium glutamicum]|uniref:hypothetical protein n=1 Tax=Corynebacterium glutamicum TaxID=1718 RepID=UPI001B8B661C|nr:hypothetical protein [Corynebacterium glutamicum]